MPAVLFDLDPARTPLVVLRCPTGCTPGLRVQESAVRPVLAGQVRPGDLIAGHFSPPAPGGTRYARWAPEAYVADPRPWDPTCPCPSCSHIALYCAPAPAAGRIVMEADDGECTVWDADDIALVIATRP